MLFNLLTEPIEPTFQAKAISNNQLWIIGITAFAVVITILATIIMFCLYSQTQKPKKLFKYVIVIAGIIIAAIFIIFGIIACNSIR